jgi:hypothetical protein
MVSNVVRFQNPAPAQKLETKRAKGLVLAVRNRCMLGFERPPTNPAAHINAAGDRRHI